MIFIVSESERSSAARAILAGLKDQEWQHVFSPEQLKAHRPGDDVFFTGKWWLRDDAVQLDKAFAAIGA